LTISRVGSFGGGSDSGNTTVVLPGGISFGDAIGAIGVCSTSQTITPPGGWTAVAGFPVDSGNCRTYCWTKDQAQTSDSGASVVFTNSAGNKVTIVGFVLHSTNGFPTSWADDVTWQDHTSGASYTAPQSVSTADGDWPLACMVVRGTDPGGWTPASGLTELEDRARTGGGATSAHLCEGATAPLGTSGATFGPFTETNITSSTGGGLTWLVKENASGGGGGGGGSGGGGSYPKIGLWRNHDGETGSWRTKMNRAVALYGEFGGHWSQYFGVGELPISAEVEQAFRDGKDIHIYWKAWDTSWANTGSGGYDTELDQVAADVVALCAGSGRKLWLTVGHEPENDADLTGGSGFEAADYRAMWTRVRSRFDTAGASQYVTFVLVWMNSHSNPSQRFSGPGQGMITLYGNDGVMDAALGPDGVICQQDYIVKGTTPQTIADKWLEDLAFLTANRTASRKWAPSDRPQAFTEWGADLGGGATDRGTNLHRAQTIDAIRGILPQLAAQNVVEARYFDARTDAIDDPPAVDGLAFQALKAASEAGQTATTGPTFEVGFVLARDGLTATSNTLTFDLSTVAWQPGDYALAFLWLTSQPTMSTEPAGWTLIDGPTNNSTTFRAWVYAKRLAAGEANPSWVVSQSLRGSGIIGIYRGVDEDDPILAQSVLAATSSGTSHNVPALVTTEDAYIVSAWGVRWADASGNGGVNYGAAPAGTHTEDAQVSPNSGANPGAGGVVGHVTDHPVAPGTLGPYAATFPVTSTGLGTQIALRSGGATQAIQLVDEGAGADSLAVATGTVPKALADSGIGRDTMSIAVAGATPGRFPAMRVEIDVSGQNPLAASPVWTNITSWCQWPAEISFGRPDQFSDVEPATLRMAINNNDGRFTMGKTDGPYGANIQPGVRIRVTLTLNAVAYARFDGHVDAWPTDWLGSDDRAAESAITATCRLKRIGGNQAELRGLPAEEALADGASLLYPLDESSGATSAGNLATVREQASAALAQFGSTGGTVSFGAADGPGPDGPSGATFEPGPFGAQYLKATPIQAGAATAITLVCWFRTTAIPAAFEQVMVALGNSGAEQLSLQLAIDGTLQGFYIADGRGAWGNAGGPAVNDGRLHMAALTLARSGSTVTARLYVDGAQIQTNTFTGDPLPTWSMLEIGAGHLGPYLPFAGDVFHVGAYDTVLSAAQLLEQYQAGSTGLAGERTDQRITRLAGYLALPASSLSLDVGDKLMGGQATAGKAPLEALREVARVEQSVIYADGQGRLVFQRRSRRYNPSPAVTVSWTAKQVQVGANLPGDDFGVTNDFTANRPDGASMRAVNADSITARGPYRDSLEVPAYNDAAVAAIGHWRVALYGEPKPRLPNLTFSLLRLSRENPTLCAQLLGLAISSMIRLTNLPSQAPASTLDLFVEGWSEVIDRKQGLWTITFNCSPADGHQAWQLGVPGFSELGSTTFVVL
jgi:hypothetical protein